MNDRMGKYSLIIFIETYLYRADIIIYPAPFHAFCGELINKWKKSWLIKWKNKGMIK